MTDDFTTLAAQYFEQGHGCGFKDGYSQALKDKQDNFLSKSEIDFLVKKLSDRLQNLQVRAYYYKKDSAYYWEVSDKNNPDTYRYFKVFSLNQQELKRVKKEMKRLSEIQSKLKKLRGA